MIAKFFYDKENQLQVKCQDTILKQILMNSVFQKKLYNIEEYLQSTSVIIEYSHFILPTIFDEKNCDLSKKSVDLDDVRLKCCERVVSGWQVLYSIDGNIDNKLLKNAYIILTSHNVYLFDEEKECVKPKTYYRIFVQEMADFERCVVCPIESLCPQLPKVIAMFDLDYIESIQELFDQTSILMYLHSIKQSSSTEFIYFDFISSIYLNNFFEELEQLFPIQVHTSFTINPESDHDEKENILDHDSYVTGKNSITQQSFQESRDNSYIKPNQKNTFLNIARKSEVRKSNLSHMTGNIKNADRQFELSKIKLAKNRQNQKIRNLTNSSNKLFNNIKPQKYYFEYYYLFRFLEAKENEHYKNMENNDFSEDEINYLELLQCFKLKLHIYSGVLLKSNEYNALIANTSGNFDKINLYKEFEKVIIQISEEYDYIYFQKINSKCYNQTDIKNFLQQQLQNAKEEQIENPTKNDFFDIENYKQHYKYCIPDFNCNSDIYEKMCEYETFHAKESEDNYYLEEKYQKNCQNIFDSFFKDLKWSLLENLYELRSYNTHYPIIKFKFAKNGQKDIIENLIKDYKERDVTNNAIKEKFRAQISNKFEKFYIIQSDEESREDLRAKLASKLEDTSFMRTYEKKIVDLNQSPNNHY